MARHAYRKAHVRVRTENRFGTDAGRIAVSVDDASRATDWYGRGAMGVLGLGYSGGLNQPVSGVGFARKEPALSRKGLNKKAAVILIGILALILAASILTSLSGMLRAQETLAGVNKDLTIAKNDFEALRNVYEAETNGINIGYEAAQRGMISAKGANTIRITLPQTIRLNTANGGQIADQNP